MTLFLSVRPLADTGLFLCLPKAPATDCGRFTVAQAAVNSIFIPAKQLASQKLKLIFIATILLLPKPVPVMQSA